jgi:predicted amidohydrolase
MRVACIQLCSGTDIKANLYATENLIRTAHDQGARFIATPETTNIIQDKNAKLFEAIRPEEECQEVDFFSSLAKELKIDLMIGSMAIKVSNAQAANRSFLFGRDGFIKARYDKMHLFDVTINETETWRESATYKAGLKPTLAAVGDFKLGMSICYDLRFAALYKHYAALGANILAIPSAFTPVTGKAHWKTLLKARAIETSSYVIAPAQGGIHENGRVTWGHSMIIDPWGKIIAHLDHDRPGFCIADLSHDRVRDIRAKIPAWDQETILPAGSM